MAAVSLSTMAADITAATPTTVAAAIGGSATADNVAALVKLLVVLAARNDLSVPPLVLVNDVQLTPG